METVKNNRGGVLRPHRESNLELYRIIVMLAIVAHHYVVNSGLVEEINNSNPTAFNSLFLLLFGCWGKIGINCFVLITGYFMCQSNITLRKFLKLSLEWMFYKIVIYFLFALCGYEVFSPKEVLKALIPFRSLTDGFVSCYIIFFLFIPFLNILIHGMNEKQHRWLLILSLSVFSVLASFPFMNVGSSYVFWFMNLYLVSSYIRLYPIPLFENTRFWGWMSVLAVACSCVSVVCMAWLRKRGISSLDYHFFLADSNKITALAVALCLFMFFKNWKLKYNPVINTIAASTYGVLCIHANSDAMRRWLWQDVCNNVGFFTSDYLVIHAVGSVVTVFAICVVLDQLRIRFVEIPFFKLYDQAVAAKTHSAESRHRYSKTN